MLRSYAGFALGVVGFHIISAIVMAGTRHDAVALLSAPFYIIWKMFKLPFILKTAQKDARWIRTPRQSTLKEELP
jgi:hypothetical protein